MPRGAQSYTEASPDIHPHKDTGRHTNSQSHSNAHSDTLANIPSDTAEIYAHIITQAYRDTERPDPHTSQASTCSRHMQTDTQTT